MVRHVGGPLWLYDAKDGIHDGMSGSSVLLSDGSAMGVVCVAGGVDPRLYAEGGPNPRLMTNLPGWFLLALAIDGLEAADSLGGFPITNFSLRRSKLTWPSNQCGRNAT